MFLSSSHLRVVDCEERTASWLDEGRLLEHGEYGERGSRNELNGIEAKCKKSEIHKNIAKVHIG